MLLCVTSSIALSSSHNARLITQGVSWDPAPTDFKVTGIGTKWWVLGDVEHRNSTHIPRTYTFNTVLLIDGTSRSTHAVGFLVEFTGGDWETCPVGSNKYYWNPGPLTSWVGTTKKARANGVMKYQGTTSGNPYNTPEVNVGFVY